MSFFANQLIVSALAAMLSAQLAKVVLILLTEHRWVPQRMYETGGMPSSHSATVAALCTSSALNYGVESPYFAISMVYGMIVIYDATGIRRAAGRHAEILNELVQEFSHLFEKNKGPTALKTLLGHTYPQVFLGSGLGVGMGFFVRYLFRKG